MCLYIYILLNFALLESGINPRWYFLRNRASVLSPSFDNVFRRPYEIADRLPEHPEKHVHIHKGTEHHWMWGGGSRLRQVAFGRQYIYNIYIYK